MKRVFYFLVLFVLILISYSCSRKHKVHRSHKEKTAYEHTSHQQGMQQHHESLTNAIRLRYKQATGEYKIWDLKGKVQLLPNGQLQAEGATIHSWTITEVNHDQDTHNETHSNYIETTEATKEEQLLKTTKSRTTTKRKTKPAWWGIVLIVLLGIVVRNVRHNA